MPKEKNINQTIDPLEMDQRAAFLADMIRSVSDLSFWILDSEKNLINDPGKRQSYDVMEASGCLDYLYRYAESESDPMIVNDALAQNWLAVPYRTETMLQRIYILGPVFRSEVKLDLDYISSIIETYPQIRSVVKSRSGLLKELEQVPVVSQVILFNYILMLCYCVTGEKKNAWDVRHYSGFSSAASMQEKAAPARDRSPVYKSEKNMLRMVREGDLSYMDTLNELALMSSGPAVSGKTPGRQERDSVIVFITLCTRAAMEGGLSPNIAYELGDSYIQAVEDAKSTLEIGDISAHMYDDFVHRVHDLNIRPDLSPAIQRACDYIDTHPEEELSIEMLAEMAGYTDYYFSRKFKDEVHTPPVRYINQARINRAKSLLSSSDLEISEIAERLHFATRSHFGEMFKKMTGMTPKEYREGK